jgi:hypothetical protein
MGLKRRAFLRQTGLALTAFSASETMLSVLSDRLLPVLADPTPRKLALLIGINQYRDAPLYGCVTDVELQRELLIHRFGFQTGNILTLTDQQATRAAIESACVSHLVEQARSGDVVVFHFSGYTSQVMTGKPPETVQTSLVPWDEPIQSGEVPVVNEVLETTLFLLLRSLQTEKITTVLDSNYFYPGKPLQGNLRIRALPRLAPVQLSAAELEFQEQLLSQRSNNSAFPSSSAPGVLLTAAKAGQMATEAHWNGASAGLFTFALTQQLWQASQPTTLRIWLNRVTEQVEQLGNQEQEPELAGQKSQEPTLLPYYLPVRPISGADGVVTAVDENGKIAQIWLGGLPPTLLEYYGVSSLLNVAPDQSFPTNSAPPLQLQLTSRDGLTARAKLFPPPEAPEGGVVLEAGQFVREQVRVLPRNIGLTVALDSCLERIERVDAISALTSVPRLSSITAGEQAADYLFSKTQNALPTQVAALPNAPLSQLIAGGASTQGGYGLFSLGRDLIPNTVGEKGEAIKVAMRRLVPKLQTLLAAKLLHLTMNQYSSHLAVEASLDVLATNQQTLLQRKTITTPPFSLLKNPNSLSATEPPGGLPALPAGSRIQYRLENRSGQPLYYLVLKLTSSRDLMALYFPPARSPDSPETPVTEISSAIAAGETLILPPPSTPLQWILHGPAGVAETFLIFSRSPFTQTLALMASTLRPSNTDPVLSILQNSLDIAQAVLQDLHQASASAHSLVTSDGFALDMNAWATLRFLYRVV